MRNTWNIFAILLCGLLTIVTSLLIREQVRWQKEAIALSQIKEEYEELVACLRRTTVDGAAAEEESSGDEKKKFIIVNRESRHLREGALALARKHNLVESVQRIYENDAFLPGVVTRKSRVKKSARRRRRSSIGIVSPIIRAREHGIVPEAIFQWPLKKGTYWFSSPYGSRRRPDGRRGFHTGIDLAAVRGTPVYAAGSGIVVQAGFVRGYGNMVLISHERHFKTRYAHLSEIWVNVGDEVNIGDGIGAVGATGSIWRRKGRDGSHLHFEVYYGSRHVNPMNFLA